MTRRCRLDPDAVEFRPRAASCFHGIALNVQFFMQSLKHSNDIYKKSGEIGLLVEEEDDEGRSYRSTGSCD